MLFLANCQFPELLPLIRLVKNGLYPIMLIVIPILLIVLGVFDLGKAVLASKEDEIKSAQKLLIKRVIYAVAIFFIVLIIRAVFDVVAGSGAGVDGTANWYDCWSEA